MSDPTTTNERLEALGGMVDDLEADNPTPGQRQEQERAATEEQAAEQGAKDWAMVPFMIGGLVCMIAPELKPVYSEERCLILGKHFNQVANKYGWNSPSNMPELGLAACALSFALPTYFVLREKMREMKEGKASGMLAKVGIWWRARKAARAGTASQAEESASDGGK